jgi:hypothetical protein
LEPSSSGCSGPGRTCFIICRDSDTRIGIKIALFTVLLYSLLSGDLNSLACYRAARTTQYKFTGSFEQAIYSFSKPVGSFLFIMITAAHMTRKPVWKTLKVVQCMVRPFPYYMLI